VKIIKFITSNHLTAILCVLLLLLQAASTNGQGRVLEDISFDSNKQQSIINIKFTLPVRYVRHHPLDRGKEVVIQLRPVVGTLEGALDLRIKDNLFPPKNNAAGIYQIEYDGSSGNGPTVTVTFDRARYYSVQQGSDFRSLSIILPANSDEKNKKTSDTDPDSKEPSPLAKQPVETEPFSYSNLPALSQERQEALFKEGEEVMAAEDYMRAVQVYTRLTDSSDPEIRQFAQFQLALAQENQGHLAHARAEYATYLKDYPDGPYTEEARKRLQYLQQGRSGGIWAQGESLWQSELFGSIGQYYERDQGYPESDGISVGENSIVNYSTLLSTYDITYRLSTDSFYAQAVAVGSYEAELAEGDNRFRRNALYIEVEDYNDSFSARVGRQRANSGGILNLFDGAVLGYRLTDSIKLNLGGGFIVDQSYDDFNTDRHFLGFSLDLGRFWNHWDYNVYFIDQVAEGIEDRRSIGLEARYTSERVSMFSLFDYDILYDEPVIMLFSSNWLLPNDLTRVFVSFDLRTSPILSTYNALMGSPVRSLDTLVNLLGEDEVQQLALDRTVESKYATVGLSHPINDDFQIAADIAWSNLGGAPGSGGVEPIDPLGDEYYYNLQFYGSNLILDGDLSSLSLRYADTKQRDTYSVLINSSYPYPSLRELKMSPKLRIDYRTNKNGPGDQWQFRPGLIIQYDFTRKWHLEVEGEYRWANRELEGLAEDKTGYYVAFGLSWDF